MSLASLRCEGRTPKKVFKMFQVNVMVNGKVVRSEKIETMPELKSFAYGIFLSPAIATLHCNRTGAMLMVDQDGVQKLCSRIPEDDNFLRKFKKSQYATV